MYFDRSFAKVLSNNRYVEYVANNMTLKIQPGFHEWQCFKVSYYIYSVRLFSIDSGTTSHEFQAMPSIY